MVTIKNTKNFYRVCSLLLLGVIVLISIWSLISLRKNTMLYYDEITDLMPMPYIRNGCGSFQSLSATRLDIHCWPIINGILYQGSLRGYLLLPLILLGKLTPTSVAVFSFALLILCGFIIYKIGKQLGYSDGLSLLISITFISLPIVWTNVLYDLGPVTIQLLVRTALLLSIFKDIKRGRFSSRITVALAVLLIWGKMDGIWFVSSAITGSFIIQILVQRKISFIKSATDYMYVVVVTFTFVISMIVTKFQGADQFNIDIFMKLRGQIPTNFSVGTLPIPYNVDFSRFLFFGQLLSPILIISAILTLVVVRINTQTKLLEKFIYLTAIQTLIIYIFIIITPRATAPWHTVSLMPSGLFPFIYVVSKLRLQFLRIFTHLHIPNKIYKIYSLTGPIVLVLAFISISTFNLALYTDIKNTKPKALSSVSLISRIIEITDESSKDVAIVFTSWGLYNSTIIDSRANLEVQGYIYDGWPWYKDSFTIADTKTQVWLYSEGPLKTYRRFIFVGIDGAPGSTGIEVEKQIQAANLCLVDSQSYVVGSDRRRLTVSRASKC